MYAIIQDGGHQYRVEPGSTVRIQLKDAEAGSEFTFDRVAAVGGDELRVGAPYLDGVTVRGTVLRHGRDRKIVVRHFRRRKNHRRKHGHRQGFTEVRIDSIDG